MSTSITKFIRKILYGEGLSESLEKKRATLMYIFCGGLTTLVNLVSFGVLYKVFHVNSDVNQVISWFISVVLAFLTNKFFVFCSRDSLWREFFNFVMARIATLLVIELGFFKLTKMGLMLSLDKGADDAICAILGINITCTDIAKYLNLVIIMISNYILSKLMVFKNKKVSDA